MSRQARQAVLIPSMIFRLNVRQGRFDVAEAGLDKSPNAVIYHDAFNTGNPVPVFKAVRAEAELYDEGDYRRAFLQKLALTLDPNELDPNELGPEVP